MIIKTEEEIHKFYVKNILPGMKSLESKRKKINAPRKFVTTLVCTSLVLMILIGIALHASVAENIATGLSIAFFFLFITLIICLVHSDSHEKKHENRYKEQVRNKITQRLITFVAPDLKHEPMEKIPEGTFLRSELFKQKPHKYNGQNKVSGIIGKTKIVFSEIQALAKGIEDDYPFFTGLFFVADFNKHFRTRTLVLPDLAERTLGNIGQTLQSLNPFRPPLIKLDNPEFEKEFAVYADDQIEARYILSPALIDRILTFQNKHDMWISLSFVRTRVFLAIHSLSYPLFNPNISISLFDYNQITEYCAILQMALGVVDELNLNTRIWSKE